jgi:hypothetical protein
LLPLFKELVESPEKVTKRLPDHLNLEERLCIALQYSILAMFSEIKYSEEEEFYIPQKPIQSREDLSEELPKHNSSRKHDELWD